MTRRWFIPFAAACLLTSSVAFSGVVDAPYEVGLWKGFCTAAATYTFDDNCPGQTAVAIPMFNEYALPGTFYLITNQITDWAPWQAAAANGHEIGSHSADHVNLAGLTVAQETYQYAFSQSTINSYIPGNQCLTIAYPFGRDGSEALCSQYFLSGRTCSGGIEPSTPPDWYSIANWICGTHGGVKDLADFTAKCQQAMAAHGWVTFLIHGIDNDGGYSPYPSTVLRQTLEYLNANRSTLWTATYLNVVRYVKERDAVSVQQLSASDTAISVLVTDTLDNTVYCIPVTLRRPLPAGWTAASVSQNGHTVSSSIVTVNGSPYVMFDAKPDGGTVVITKTGGGGSTPPAAPTGLAAVAGDARVTLNWNDNGESDLSSYNVYRSTSAGGPYPMIASNRLTSDYVDLGVANGTTYYYVVAAVNTSGQVSPYSAVVSATPTGGGSGGTMHVVSVDTVWVPQPPNKYKGQATVVIKDASGNAVSGATVSGTFTGLINESDSAVTDASGTAVIRTVATKRSTGSLAFCVDNVTLTGWTYDAGGNLMNCGSAP